MEESFSAEPESSCQPRNTTIKYEDVYGGIPVNLGINVAVWLVSFVTVAAVFSCQQQESQGCVCGIPVNLAINIAVSLGVTVSQETQLLYMRIYTVAACKSCHKRCCMAGKFSLVLTVSTQLSSMRMYHIMVAYQ